MRTSHGYHLFRQTNLVPQRSSVHLQRWIGSARSGAGDVLVTADALDGCTPAIASTAEIVPRRSVDVVWNQLLAPIPPPPSHS